jgi:hypothetical protein
MALKLGRPRFRTAPAATSAAVFRLQSHEAPVPTGQGCDDQHHVGPGGAPLVAETGRKSSGTVVTKAELLAAIDFLRTLIGRRPAIDPASLRVEALAAGIAQGALWQAAQRIGGVPGWSSGAQWRERAH